MQVTGIVTLAVGVAMDAAAVAAVMGLAARHIRLRDALVVAAYFGGFQALMPVLGWLLGVRLGPVVSEWDHWIAFILLGGVGGKMLWDARRNSDADAATAAAAAAATAPDRDRALFGFRNLVTLAIATSIDAFAIGITLPMLNAPVAVSALTIGCTTSALSVAGLLAGRRFGGALGPRLESVGGAILIGMGVKILVEHLRHG